MGRHPLGADADPNPRFMTERLVDSDALGMGATAENLHDRYPESTKERADAYAVASQAKYAAALDAGHIGPELVPVGIPDSERGCGPATAHASPRPGHTLHGSAHCRSN